MRYPNSDRETCYNCAEPINLGGYVCPHCNADVSISEEQYQREMDIERRKNIEEKQERQKQEEQYEQKKQQELIDAKLEIKKFQRVRAFIVSAFLIGEVCLVWFVCSSLYVYWSKNDDSKISSVTFGALGIIGWLIVAIVNLIKCNKSIKELKAQIIKGIE